MVWGDTLNFSIIEFAKGPRILNMVVTFVLTPWSNYNTIIEPRARFLLSLLENFSIDFPSHMIVSMIDIYRDIATHDKRIFPSTITCILTHLHITIPSSPLFYSEGAISKESIWKSDVQLVAKRPHVEPTLAQQEEAAFRVARDAAYAFRPASSSTSSSSFGVEASLVAILNQLQHMRADFGCCLDHLSDEKCQIYTKIGRITQRQSRLGSFSPSPSPKPAEDSSDGGEDDDDASGSSSDDEMIVY